MRETFVYHCYLAGTINLACVLLTGLAVGQAPQAPAPERPPVHQSDDPLLKNFKFRSIGPASMGGRIDDIAVVESDPFTIYVGFATGGLWKTVNNGTTWEPIFDTYSSASIGDIAIFQADPNTVWVGTGEPNNRQSSSFGDGVYKSTDGGRTFVSVGLRETQTIGRIVLDPKDPNVAYVAAVGHLFGPNPERGVFKTMDGGKTWNKVLFVNEETGVSDLAMDPSDSRILYACSYQRRRTPWGFNGGGPGSGIWKTVDAGKNWARISGGGFPSGDFGRIGIDASRSNPNVICAQIEKEYPQPGFGPGGAFAGGPPGGPPAGPQAQAQVPQPPNPNRSGIWRSDDKGKTWRIVSNNNNRPMYYSQIRVDPSNDQILYTGGLQFSKSTDGGKTFQAMGGVAHSDHHAIWINSRNGNHLIIGNDGGLDISYDQGATWEFVNTIPAGQFYAVAADMRRPYYVYGGLQDNGSWGGPSATRSGPGITNADWFRVAGGDGFYAQVDPTDCNTVYVESQNGAVQRVDLKMGRSASIRPRASSPPRVPRAGQQERPQGAPTQQAEDQPVTAGAQPPPEFQQFGFFGGPQTANILPAPPVGEQYRFNWNTPIHLSAHNPRTIYVGANKLFKSVNRGDTWAAGPDLTKQINRDTLSIMGVPGDKPMFSKNDGTSSYGTITTVAESPVLPGVLWVGTDDGNVQLSRDGGTTWTNLSDKFPQPVKTYQVSRVEPSHFDAGTGYVSFDGHRNDDMKPYLFVTTDYGATWRSLSANLPMGNVNVVREDLKNRNLLFAGTEFGLFISLNGGAEWKRFMTGLPTVRVDDLLIHPRDNDLIVATHGRSIYILDDISPLQQLTPEVLTSEVHLFSARPGIQWMQDYTIGRALGGAKNFVGANAATGTAISYHLKSAVTEDVKIAITDVDGKVVRNLTGPKEAGLNRVQWNLRGSPPQRPAGAPAGFGGRGRFGAFQGPSMEPGVYFVKLTVGGKDYTTKVRVEEDTYKN